MDLLIDPDGLTILKLVNAGAGDTFAGLDAAGDAHTAAFSGLALYCDRAQGDRGRIGIDDPDTPTAFGFQRNRRGSMICDSDAAIAEAVTTEPSRNVGGAS